jgi:hypothetical protein
VQVAIYDADDKLVLFMDATEDQIALNVPEGGRFEEVPPERMVQGATVPPPAKEDAP